MEKKYITVFLTGLPCSGKTTIAKQFIKKWNGLITDQKFAPIPLDGDHLRSGLTSHLGFSPEDRAENMRIVGHLAQLINDMQMNVICSFVSPTEALRQKALDSIKNPHVVYVKCSADKCAERDVKGMWKLAKEGEIEMFTGYSAPYEEPKDVDLVLDTEKLSLEECVDLLMDSMLKF